MDDTNTPSSASQEQKQELCRYPQMALSEILLILQALREEFEDYLHLGLGYRKDQYTVYELDILEAIIRVDKRRNYFLYFHGMSINDDKKAALFAYWIAKFRPVRFTDVNLRNDVAHANVNEKLAVHHLLCALVGKKKIKLWDGQDGVELDKKNKFITDLQYSFQYRNLTIDSMIVLAESISTDSFKQGIAYHIVAV